MSKTLLIESDKKRGEMFALNLNMYVGTDVIVRKSLDEALELVKVLPEIDLIIARKDIEEKPVAYNLYHHLKSEGQDIPMIVLGKESGLGEEDNVREVELGAKVEELIPEAAKLLGVTAKMMAEKPTPEYYPIDIQYFYHLSSSPSDVYVRIKKGGDDGGFQHVKRIHQGESLDMDTVDRYKKKGMKELFVESAFRLEFTQKFTAAVVEKLDDPNLSVEERASVGSSTYDFVGESLESIGVSEETIQLANASIRSMTKNVAQSPKLKSMLASLMKSKASYRFKHCQLICFISFHIVDNMEWGSKEQSDKLSFVAYFHDIFLQNDEEAMINDARAFEDYDGSAESKERVKLHAMKAAEIVKTYPNSPIGADNLIKEHHGAKNGVGFPENIAASISPLAIVFIVAETFVHDILRLGENFDKEGTLAMMEERFSTGKFRKAMEALRISSI